jgi:hypothetical protein
VKGDDLPYPGMCLEGVEKTAINLSQGGQCPAEIRADQLLNTRSQALPLGAGSSLIFFMIEKRVSRERNLIKTSLNPHGWKTPENP